ncbi:hypothetical protein OCJ37_01805 [Xanthomonas sp. AM6]|uniref:hypothetical protein n=1 Tax=Xanthomonas sp. AM6 TaxID=2982531 RepID=UPI0021D88E95|nr:hypothetical protein [Xanthomonas sp. AM6]UYB52726.1 hypothetical protein OCJ37_01805 [Xanthomonas sp. AM6]
MDNGFLLQLLTTVGFQLPILLVLGAGVVLLSTRRPGRARTLGLWGLSLLLVGGLCGSVTSLLPIWIVSQGGTFSSYAAWYGILQAVFTILHAVAMLLVVLALRFALPR